MSGWPWGLPGRDARGSVCIPRCASCVSALTLGVCSALCVCLLMTLVFAGPLFDFNTAKPVAFLFLLSLFTYTAALVCLMREVFLAIGSFRLGIHEVVESPR